MRLINVNAATKNQKHWIDERARARMGAPAHIWRINEFEILFRVFNHKFIFEFSRILFSFAVAKDLYENDSEILRNIVCVCVDQFLHFILILRNPKIYSPKSMSDSKNQQQNEKRKNKPYRNVFACKVCTDAAYLYGDE